MRVTHVGLAFVLVAAAPAAARAEKVLEKEELVLNVGALLQPQALVEEAAAPNGSAGTDFFLRRARLMLYGNLTKRVSFFVETEQANLGKDGDWSSSIFLLDAFASVETVPGVFVDAGLMLVPFTRHDLQGATSLNGLDYHGALIKFPTGSQRSWRDVGVQGRASLADDHVVLRGGIFNGVEGGVLGDEGTGMMMQNDADLPRAAAHARYVVVGKEDGFFLPGIRFADEPTVSVGVGVDWQKGAIPDMDTPRDHLGVAADAFAEIPTVPDQAVIAQATFVHYDDGDGATTTGTGGFLELGYRIGRFEPTIAADVFAADGPDDAGDLRGFHVGGAAFLDKHKANLKLDLARIESGAADARFVGTLQAQLLF